MEKLLDKLPAINDPEFMQFKNSLSYNSVSSSEFIDKFDNWIKDNRLNSLTGLDNFPTRELCFGVTHFIDNLIMQHGSELQVLENDYLYYKRLWPNKIWSNVGNLKRNTPLIIALPFPGYGIVHPLMNQMLDEALNKNVAVHLDCAWLPASRNILFDFDHPAIKSFAISLSKGLALSWNRIAVRYSRQEHDDAISIANKFNMINEVCVSIGHEYMQRFPINFLWEKHGKNYHMICKEFKVIPTNVIHMVKDPKTGKPLGTRDLLLSLSH